MKTTNNSESAKKVGSMFEKLKQNMTILREDITDNIERRRQVYNKVHFTPRYNEDEESLVIEKKPPTPVSTPQRSSPEANQQLSSGDESSTSLSRSQSSKDIFTCETNEQVREILMNNLRLEIQRCRSRATSENSIDEMFSSKTLNSTKLLTGPRFRSHINTSNVDHKRDLIYRVSIAIGLLAIILIIWQPISAFLSGYFLGFACASALAYVVIRIYLLSQTNQTIIHEWIEFPDLATINPEQNQTINSNTCCEIVFAQYNSDHDNQFIRYPAVIRLDNRRLIIQLPIKGRTDKDMKFIGFREYRLDKAQVFLVPEHTLVRAKYWLNEYPIVIKNMEISDKQMFNREYVGKMKYDVEEFFNNSQTIISFFFETCPEKEDWFHRLASIIRKPNNQSLIFNKSMSDSHLLTIDQRLSQKNKLDSNNSLNIDRSETDLCQNQINDPDLTQIQDLSTENDSTIRSMLKKKSKKIDDNLDRLLKSADCLDEAAITLNFILRRLLCDIFQENLLKDFLKEKIELKLKEIAVSVLEDLHVQSIDMGNTFPVILKFEPMQWNSRGIWFKLFLVYRGSFKITIKTRIFLQKLLSANPMIEQPMFYQNHSDQINVKEDVRTIEQEKLSTKDPDFLENVAAKKIDSLLTKVAANKHFQRFAALKPVAGVFEKISNAEIGANIELLNISGMMTLNIPPPPSDRIWLGFAEMPDLNLKVTPVFGESQYSYAFVQDFLEARIRDEIKRLLVLPAMDDLLLPFLRNWVLDTFGGLPI